MEDRRRVPRQTGSWRGVCSVEGESLSRWRECHVIDMSELGLGIEFQHFWPSDLVGRRISVDLPTVGASIKLVLEGEIRSATICPNGFVRAGIEFDGLSEDEESIAEVLALASLGGP